MIRVIDAFLNISNEELQMALDVLPQWRREQALRYKHAQGQAECALSYRLLCEMLEELGYKGQPSFEYGPNGKPHIKEWPEVHFNISHCKTALACVVDKVPVGIDIEQTGRYSERLARYTMNASELAEIADADDKDLAFTRLWTMKEATMKLTGDGISTNMRDVLADSSNIIYNTTVNTELGYVLTVARWK